MLARLLELGEQPETLDASDALALAFCHLQQGLPGALGAGQAGMSPRIAAALRAAERADRRPHRR